MKLSGPSRPNRVLARCPRDAAGQLVERPCALQVLAERLFDHDAAARGQADLIQGAEGGGEDRRRQGEVDRHGAVAAVHDRGHVVYVGEVDGLVPEPLQERLSHLDGNIASVFLQMLGSQLAKTRVVQIGTGATDDLEVIR